MGANKTIIPNIIITVVKEQIHLQKNNSEQQEKKKRRKAFSSALFLWQRSRLRQLLASYHITIVSNTMLSSFGFKKGFLNKKSSSSSSSSTTAATTTNPPPSTFQTACTIPNENDAATEVAAETLPSPPLSTASGTSINQSITTVSYAAVPTNIKNMAESNINNNDNDNTNDQPRKKSKEETSKDGLNGVAHNGGPAPKKDYVEQDKTTSVVFPIRNFATRPLHERGIIGTKTVEILGHPFRLLVYPCGRDNLSSFCGIV